MLVRPPTPLKQTQWDLEYGQIPPTMFTLHQQWQCTSCESTASGRTPDNTPTHLSSTTEHSDTVLRFSTGSATTERHSRDSEMNQNAADWQCPCACTVESARFHTLSKALGLIMRSSSDSGSIDMAEMWSMLGPWGWF